MALKIPFGIDSTKFKSGLDDMRSKTKDFGNKVDKDLNKGTKGFLNMSKGVALLSAGLTALGAITVATFSKISQKVKTLENQSGEAAVKVEELQVILQAAFKTGAGSEQTVAALKNVNTRAVDAANGAKQYQDALSRLNIDFKKFVNLPGERKLEQVARGFVGAENEAQAYRDILTLLGEDAGPKLIKFLEQLATTGFDSLNKAMRKSGQIIDKEIIDNLKDAQEAWDDFQNRGVVKATQAAGFVANIGGSGSDADVDIARATFMDRVLSMFGGAISNAAVGNEGLQDRAIDRQEKIRLEKIKVERVEETNKRQRGGENKKGGELSIAKKFALQQDFDKLFGEDFQKAGKVKEKGFKGVPVSSLQAIGGGGGIGSISNLLKLDTDRNMFLMQIAENTANNNDGSGNSNGSQLG